MSSSSSSSSIRIDRLPDTRPGSMAYRYLIGFAPADTLEWWSDFWCDEIAIDKHYAEFVAKELQKVLDANDGEIMRELAPRMKWRVCIVDISQPGKRFSEK